LQSSKTFSAVYYDGVYSTESGPLDMVNFKIYDINYNEHTTTRILFNADAEDMFGYNYSSNLDCIGIDEFFQDLSFTDTAFDSAFVGNELMARNYTFRQTSNQNHNDERVSDLENLQEENNIKYYDVYACLPYYVDREYFIGDNLDYVGSDSEKLLFWAFGGAYTISYNIENNLNQLELSIACSYGMYYDGVQVEIRSGKLYANNTLISHITYDGSKLIISPKLEGNKRTFAYFKVDVNGTTWLSHINSATAGNKGDVYDTTDTLISATSIVYSEHLNVMVNFDGYDNLGQDSIAGIRDLISDASRMPNSWLTLHSNVFIAPDNFTTLTSRQYEIRMGKVTDRTPGVDSENNTSTLIIGCKAGAAFTPVYEATTMATSLIQGYGTVSWNVYGAETNRLYASIAQLGDSYLINDCDESLIIRIEYPPQKIDVISNGAIYYFDYIRDDITEDWLVQFECTDDDRVKDITDAYNAIYRY
jgi:hypothetical protein